MKAIIFDPYLDTLGGGERYVLTFVELLLEKGWQVDIVWDDENIKDKLSKRLNIDLENLNFVQFPDKFLSKLNFFRKYDLSFWISDGSIPFLFAKNNILHFQVPFHDVNGKKFVNKIKFLKVNNIICNSIFTKRVIDKEFGVNSQVVYPPVDTASFQAGKKENIILSVGRFSQLLQAKRQDVLINAFKKMIDKGLKGWKLILAGSTDIGGKEYFESLQKLVEGYPVELIENAYFENLQDLYSRSKIFWYAAGFEIDETKDPEKVEHFGITTVEAMSAGCVCLVSDKGGLKEIVENKINGFIWDNEEELIQITSEIVMDSKLIEKISKKGIEKSSEFSNENFRNKFLKLLKIN